MPTTATVWNKVPHTRKFLKRKDKRCLKLHNALTTKAASCVLTAFFRTAYITIVCAAWETYHVPETETATKVRLDFYGEVGLNDFSSAVCDLTTFVRHA